MTTRSRPGLGNPARSIVLGVAAVLVVVGALVGGGLVAFEGPAVPAARVVGTGGEAVLASDLPLPVVDLGDGLGAASLAGVNHDIGATSYADVLPVPLDHGTLLVNRTNGSFNFLEPGDVVADDNAGGVAVGSAPTGTRVAAFPSGNAAFIVRLESARILVDLIDPALVARAARHPGSRLHPLGFADIRGTVASGATQVVATKHGLYLLLARSHTTSTLVAILRTPRHGLGLRVHLVANVANPAALETADGRVLVDGGGSIAALRGLRLAPLGPSTRAGAPLAIWPVTHASAPGWFVEEKRPKRYLLVEVGRPARPIHGLVHDAPNGIIVPVEDGRRLFTMGLTGTRRDPLITVSLRTGSLQQLAGVPQYPLAKAESPTLVDTTVSAYGTQVIYDCPNALLAVVVFTVGHHRPVIIDKGVLPSVDPNAPAGAIGSASHHAVHHLPSRQEQQPSTPKPQTPPPTVQTVTNAVNCATTDQKPSIPAITSIVPGPQTATISWSYPLISAESCEPSTYEVAISPEHGAPAPATPEIAVNGQTQAVVSGLHSGQTYQVVVTAFIGTSSTASAPASFTTTPEGADAPLSVTSTFEPGQGWLVSWTSCQGTACNVPAASWTVTSALCGSSTAFVGTPPSVTVSAPAEQALVPLATNLIGDSLSFSVAGTSPSGLVGNPTSSDTCQLGYSAPDAADLMFTAAEVPSGQGQATANLTVAPASGTSLIDDLGAPSVTFHFCVSRAPAGTCVQTQTTASPSAQFQGLELGASYYARVVIVSNADTALATTLVAQNPLSATIPWPTVTTTVQSFQALQGNPNLGQMSVSLATSSATSLPVDIQQAQLVCQSSLITLAPTPDAVLIGGSSASATVAFANFPLTDVAPPCQLTLTLASTAPVDPFSTPTTSTTAMLPRPSPAPASKPAFGFALSGTALSSTPTAGCTPIAPSAGSSGISLALTICEQQQSAQGFQSPWGSWTLTALHATLGTSPACSMPPPSAPITTDAPVSISLSSCLGSEFYDGEAIDLTGQIDWSYLGTTDSIPLAIDGTFQASTTNFATATVSHQGSVQVAIDEQGASGPTPVDGGTFSVTLDGQSVAGCSAIAVSSSGTGTCTLPAGPVPSGLTATYSPPSTALLASSASLEETQ